MDRRIAVPAHCLAARRGPRGHPSARFSRLAVASVAALTAAGAGLGWIYVGSAAAVGGTTYGAMLVSKVLLTAGLLLLGFLNFRIVRAVRQGGRAGLLPLGRFAEAEMGIGLTVLLAAASLTSTPPAVDVQAERVTTLGDRGANDAALAANGDAGVRGTLARDSAGPAGRLEAARILRARPAAASEYARGYRLVRVQPPLGGTHRAGGGTVGGVLLTGSGSPVIGRLRFSALLFPVDPG